MKPSKTGSLRRARRADKINAAFHRFNTALTYLGRGRELNADNIATAYMMLSLDAAMCGNNSIQLAASRLFWAWHDAARGVETVTTKDGRRERKVRRSWH